MAGVSEQDWIAVGKRLGLTSDESVTRARSIRSRIPAAFHQAAAESGVPAPLKSRAGWIAELVTAQVEGRRDRWGQLDVAPLDR
jgi:serine/threonine-protein kinase HipA